MAKAFDTLTTARDLEAAGLERPAAEAVAGAILVSQDTLTTKADLDALKSRLQAALWRGLLLHFFAIVAAFVALVKITP